MITVYYHTGQLRAKLVGTVLGTRSCQSHTHPPRAGLILADIQPADGSSCVTGYIKH